MPARVTLVSSGIMDVLVTVTVGLGPSLDPWAWYGTGRTRTPSIVIHASYVALRISHPGVPIDRPGHPPSDSDSGVTGVHRLGSPAFIHLHFVSFRGFPCHFKFEGAVMHVCQTSVSFTPPSPPPNGSKF
ncbi:hypothetical protein CVT25_012549 [Psilocybe cyanescens]|uniref:Uncharacterized protein n=1 Tax=Psilocybe cyanescens TaxID=93625 RepID=A0A409X0X8_PSICY|nr:hypothetical protein CVT25_012549 [Psilocybe cyanescens]